MCWRSWLRGKANWNLGEQVVSVDWKRTMNVEAINFPLRCSIPPTNHSCLRFILEAKKERYPVEQIVAMLWEGKKSRVYKLRCSANRSYLNSSSRGTLTFTSHNIYVNKWRKYNFSIFLWTQYTVTRLNHELHSFHLSFDPSYLHKAF